MRVRAVLLVLACAALAACGSTGSAGGGPGGGGDPSSAEDALPPGTRAVTGNHQVVLRTWNPNNPSAAPTTAALVNASSESGRKLQTGRATSTVVRVITDAEMGALLAAMADKGFDTVATPGLTLDGLRADGRRRGVIVVEQDGQTRGIDFGLNMGGTQVPTVYTECKKIILAVHMNIPGLEVRTSTDANDDPSRLFQAPPARLNR
jgi:hypothetical protein